MENIQNSSNNQGIGNIGNNINEQKEHNIRFQAIPNKEERDYGKEIDELKKDIGKLKEKPPKKENRIIRLLKNNWFIVGIIVILIGFDIYIHIPIVDIQSSYFGAIMGFVGILAIFIVIGNYMQVKDIENRFNERAKDLDLAFGKKITEATNELAKTAMIKDLEGNIATNMQIIAVLCQKTTADSLVTALSYCASNVKRIKETKDADSINIPRNPYSLKNIIEFANEFITRNFFKDAETETLKIFLARIEGVIGTDEEIKKIAEIKNTIYR